MDPYTKDKWELILRLRQGNFVVHPEFQPEKLEFDVAIIQLSPFRLVHRFEISPINLVPPTKVLYSEDLMYVSGWPPEETGENLTVVNAHYMERVDCQDYFTEINGNSSEHENVICAQAEYPECFGRPGDPLFMQNDEEIPIVVGVLTSDCGNETSVRIYTDLRKFHDWIQMQIDYAHNHSIYF